MRTIKSLLSLLLLVFLSLHALAKADYYSISTDDIGKCRQLVGGTDTFNALVGYFSYPGITINHGGYGGGDPNTQQSTSVNTWYTGVYHNGLFTCVLIDDTYINAASVYCPTKTPDGVCVPSIDTSPISYTSCSCGGICLKASTSFYDHQNYKPPNGDYSSYTWSTCVCHPDYYGERCQYQKRPDDIKRLAAGLIDIRDFPYLPWYTTPFEQSVWLGLKQLTMNYASTYTPNSDYVISSYIQGKPDPVTLSGQIMWSFAKTQVARGLDYANTVWAWPGSAQSCPYGMIVEASYGYNFFLLSYLDYSPNPPYVYNQGQQYLFNDIPSSFGSLNDAYMYYYGKSAQRQHFTCMCDATRGSDGCSGQGNCRSIQNGQDVHLQYTFSSDGGFPHQKYASVASIDDKSLHPPTPAFPSAFWRDGHGDPYWGYSNSLLVPSSWSLCECYPDFYGIYCEIDLRNASVCNNKGTYFDVLTGPNANKWDEPGDCTCSNGAIHFWDTGVAVVPSNYQGLPPGKLTGYNRTDFFYRLSIDRVNPSRRRQVCIDDKDYTVCNARGVFNSIYVLGVNKTTARQSSYQIGCECFLYTDVSRTQIYPRTQVINANINILNNRTLRENIAGGQYCETSCRISKCNNHGTCQYIQRSTYFQTYGQLDNQLGGSPVQFYYQWDMLRDGGALTIDASATGYFWPTEDSRPKNDYISDLVISDVCQCDDGWSGNNCQHNVASGVNCNGFGLAGSSNTSSCANLCDLTRSFYNDTLARCIGLCPVMKSLDPSDPLITDTSGIGQPCGGPTRGTCSGFDGISKTCVCNPGFTNPEQGCNLSICPRVRGQVCNGMGTCKPQSLVTSAGIGKPVYRCECAIGWKGEACEIQDRTGDYKCNSNTQQSYNRENLDWPIL